MDWSTAFAGAVASGNAHAAQASANAAQASTHASSAATSAITQLPPLRQREFDMAAKIVVDGLVLLKIAKHAHENGIPSTGQLLGMEFNGKVEVTNCFAMPEEADDAYEVEMLKAMRSLNQDYTAVGWYQVMPLDSFANQDTLMIHYNHQAAVRNAIMLVYDPLRTQYGHLSIKAMRLTDEFMTFFQGGQYSHTAYLESGLTYEDIFEEVPIKIHNSHVIHAFLFELRSSKHFDTSFDRLTLDKPTHIAKSVGLLSDSIEEFSKEQANFSTYLRNVAKQQQQQQHFLSKRKTDNAQRRANGEPELDDDYSKLPFFKPISAPSRTERFLLSKQMSLLCDVVSQAAAVTVPKVQVAEALSSPQPISDSL